MKLLLDTGMYQSNFSEAQMQQFLKDYLWVAYIFFGIAIFMVISMWKIFTKAGQPGWACLVPFYNVYILVQIAKKPSNWFWIILGLIIGSAMPFMILRFLCVIVYFVMLVMVYHGISKSFGQDIGFTIGLLLLSIVFIPLLAFGEYTYINDNEQSSSPDLMDV